MKEEHYIQAFYGLAILGYLLLYMYFAIQSWFQIMKSEVSFSIVPFKMDTKGIWGLMSKKLYPEEYFKNRVYLGGTLLLLLLPTVYALVVNA